MPDKRKHRGAHPADHDLFGPRWLPALQAAAADLRWHLDAGYAPKSSLMVVGDRFDLRERQRVAVQRATCATAQARARAARRTWAAPEVLWIDGFNVLITLEAAMGGGVLLYGQDGALRDMASMHGSWRKVEETLPAAELIGEALSRLGIGSARWLFDRPVSNSGRLRGLMEALAARRGWAWSVELVDDPDPLLKAVEGVVATADSAILDACHAYFDLARVVVESCVPRPWVLNLQAPPPEPRQS
ncbi:DUF434 domain-containing protein [Myxococcota bacterium]|nr:DUF434 domain-containing protein [Myxococcota bacterium]MBU1431414.1 DUF434 domain-containing protein [Myxococcota bacterium]MBU1897820.1 DUF434 domain-containing protein [Myxococcota bacterium]